MGELLLMLRRAVSLVLCRGTMPPPSSTRISTVLTSSFCSDAESVGSLPAGRPYPEWVDAIINGENAAGPRGNRHSKRMKQRQRQRQMDHKRRIQQTAAAQERRVAKRSEAWQAAKEYKLKWSGQDGDSEVKRDLAGS